MNPLVFFFNACFVRRDTGLHWRTFSLLRHLVDAGFPVVVYCYANHPLYPWTAEDEELFATHFPGIRLVLETRPEAARVLSRFKKLATGLMPGFVRRIAAIGPASLTPRLAQLRREYPHAVVVTCHATSLLDLNGADLPRCVVDANDIHFVQVSKRFGWPIYGLRVLEKFRCEMSLLGDVAGIISLAAADTGLLRLCLGDRPVLFVADFGAPVADVARHAPEGRAPDAIGAPRRLLFVGSDNPFNVDGISDFLSRHRDIIARYGLDVAGKVSLDGKVIAAACEVPGVRLLGFVDDLSGAYDRALAVISPVDGTGIKIKVLEALAAGVPVFGSDHTIQGLPAGHEDCVFRIDAAMPAILDDPARLDRAREAAIAWSASLSENPDLAALDALLHRLIAKRRDDAADG